MKDWKINYINKWFIFFRDSQIQRVWEPGLNQLDKEEIENSLIQNENQTSMLSSFEEPKNNLMSMSDKEVSSERSETKSDNSSDILENDNKDKVKSTIPFTEKKTIFIVTSSSLLLVVFLSLCYCSIKKVFFCNSIFRFCLISSFLWVQ